MWFDCWDCTFKYIITIKYILKLAVCSISADGLVSVVKPHIATIAEAKKAMLEIFEHKKNTVRCEFVHPQTLDEKSAELYRNQSKELPDITLAVLGEMKMDIPIRSELFQVVISLIRKLEGERVDFGWEMRSDGGLDEEDEAIE